VAGQFTVFQLAELAGSKRIICNDANWLPSVLILTWYRLFPGDKSLLELSGG
jgi:hypothetical protein